MSPRRRGLAAGARRAVRALPSPRDDAALRAARAVRDLVTGRPASDVGDTAPPATGERRRRFGSRPGPKLPPVPRVTDSDGWQVPPVSQKEGLGHGFHAQVSTRSRRFDVDLLEQLNEDYRSRPVVPQPRSWTAEGLAAEANRRVLWAHHTVDLADKTVLEVGCGDGYELWSMAHNLGASAHGVDVQESPRWADLADERVRLQRADLTEHNPFAEDTFDRVVSYTVWEHVQHPHALLRETFRVMKPGALQWLRANLWAGPLASHRYRDIYFPWPHHLFSDDVIAAWDAAHGRPPEGAAWVNKLTWNHYERYVHDIGFRLRRVSFQKTEWDEEFYRRFEDVLGRIPRWDLERDFFTAVLEKPTHTTTQPGQRR